MSAFAFQILVQPGGTIDGATAFVPPDPLPTPTNGVYVINPGAVNVGTINLHALIGANTPLWLRSFQIEYQPLVRAARAQYVIPGQRQPVLVQPVQAGNPTLVRCATLNNNCIVPFGAILNLLTDDTDETFGGAPVPGPHQIYFEIEPLATDEQLAIVQELSDYAVTKRQALSTVVESFQDVAANLSVDSGMVEVFDGTPLGVFGLQSQPQVQRITVTNGDVAAAGESMTIVVSRVSTAGVATVLSTFVLDSTTPANSAQGIPITQLGNRFLQRGDRIRIARTYVAGGGPTPMTNTNVRVEIAPMAMGQ